MKYSIWIAIGGLVLAGSVSFYWSAGTAQNQNIEDTLANASGRAEHVLVTDDLERRVEIAAPVTRVVSCYSAFTNIIEELDAVEYIVGATSRQAKRLGIPSVGNHLRPDSESILACNPKLVILSSNRAQVVQTLESRLKAADIRILASHPDTVEDTLRRISEVGRIIGRRKEAEKLVTRAKTSLKEVAEDMAGVPFEQRPVVFLEVRSMPNLLTCGKDSVAYDVIQRAGGRPLYRQPGSVDLVSLEMVVEREPDAYIQQFGVMNRNPMAPSEHQVLGHLDCVKKGRVLKMDEKLISRPGPDIAEAVRRVHEFLYAAEQGLSQKNRH